MTKNPFINAIAATLYIALVASIMFYGPRLSGAHEKDTVIIPIAMISLFTLSATVMGYLFLYEPLQLYFSDNKKKAVKLFLQTVAVFAAITLTAFMALFSGIL